MNNYLPPEKELPPNRVIETVITDVRPAPGRSNSKPRHTVVFQDGTSAQTEPGAQVFYTISNSEYRDVPVKVVLNPQGHVVGIETADGVYQSGARK